MRASLKKPTFLLCVVLPLALLAQYLWLNDFSVPVERGSALSTYEIRLGVADTYLTRNQRFFLSPVWDQHNQSGAVLVLRETVTTSWEPGVEGARSMVKLESLGNGSANWSLEEPGDKAQVINELYQVTKFGCCGSPSTYTYFSLLNGRKLRVTHAELGTADLETLLLSLVK